MRKTFKTYLHIASTTECFATFEYQWISFIMLYTNVECLQMTGTHNVMDAKSFMTAAISQTVLISSVGKTLPLYYKIPLASVEIFSY